MVQQSFLPDMQRPVGPVPGSVQTGTNAELIATVAPLYLTGAVLDVTYGTGGWWKEYQPHPFTAHDLNTDGVDFRALPEDDNSYDAVCFDPPYIPQGGDNHMATGDWGTRYGLTRSLPQSELDDMFTEGMAEAARVTREWVLIKCTDYTSSAILTVGSVKVVNLATALGLVTWDLIVHHTGPGPGGHNIFTVRRCRRHHSYLVVFRKRGTPGSGKLREKPPIIVGDGPPW